MKAKDKKTNRFATWIIHKFGGFTAKDNEDFMKRWEETINLDKRIVALNKQLLNDKEDYLNSLKTAQAEIAIDSAIGYTPTNVVNESKAQVFYSLGKAVYPYAHHFITDDTYICSVNVQDTKH